MCAGLVKSSGGSRACCSARVVAGPVGASALLDCSLLYRSSAAGGGAVAEAGKVRAGLVKGGGGRRARCSARIVAGTVGTGSGFCRKCVSDFG